MIFFFDFYGFFAIFIVLLLVYCAVRVMMMLSKRRKKPPKIIEVPKGYIGAQRLDYAEHPDVALGRKPDDLSSGRLVDNPKDGKGWT